MGLCPSSPRGKTLRRPLAIPLTERIRTRRWRYRLEPLESVLAVGRYKCCFPGWSLESLLEGDRTSNNNLLSNVFAAMASALAH